MSPDQQLAILYVPCGSEEEAARLAMLLIEERLAACANIYASRSLYRWEGKVADQTEHVLWAKTTVARAETATRRIEELHSYEIPSILALSPDVVDVVSEAYSSWVRREVSGAPEVETAIPSESN